ncbi:hypothetical protein G3A49_11975 [Haloferax volcanii]|uniref:DUF8053 domain-containing protein n=1 Tax=Haloferax volcanii TaxID=2246 RepID=A0A558GA56_HALVO|nr:MULTISPECIES: hypothetical protein [Haloferax]QIB78816.1 hypothetical protein G3A49_11975 [Haloferax alexandrinus]TVT94647.1 hypothetical protein FQA18_10715 [Haloferax volcanii]
MVFRKLRNHDGTPLVALDRDDLVLDGVIAADEDDREEKTMHVQRLGKEVYVVRPVPEDGPITPLVETELVQGLVGQEIQKIKTEKPIQKT